MFNWLFGKRSEPDCAHIPEAQWQEALAPYPFLRALDAAEQTRLLNGVIQFFATKEFAGAAGLTVSPQMQLQIAAQAVLPVLNLNVDMFAGFHGIVVYPGEILAHREVMDEDGIVHEYDEVIAGEAMPGGPVVLSWEDVSMSQDHAARGYNVVIHEFAHKLDMLDGDADGVPPFDARFHAGLTRKLWNEVATPAYEALCRDVDVWERRGEPDDAWPALDPYAAEHPAEFFAVSAEVLFTDPLALQMRFPEWHALLKRYFRTS